MNCEPCRKAGFFNTEALRAPTLEEKEQIWEIARGWHAKCKQPATCTCQHRVGDWIDKTKVKNDNQG